jgi:hypothetical protein
MNRDKKSNDIGNIFVAVCAVYFFAWIMGVQPKDTVGWAALFLAAVAVGK